MGTEGSVGETSHRLADLNPQHSSAEQHKLIKTGRRRHGLLEGLPLISTLRKPSVIPNTSLFERKLSCHKIGIA